MSKKIAIVIGHHKKAKGSFSPHLHQQEWDFFNDFLSDDSVGDFADVIHHNPNINGYTSRQKALANITECYNLVIELHFDAFNGNAKGCHAKYWHSNKVTEKIASRLCEDINAFMGIKNRGPVKVYDSHDRGNGFICQQKTDAILLECFFGDNQSDVEKFDKEKFICILKNLEKTL